MASDAGLPDRPGWYRDSDGIYEHEAYWDGNSWTGETRRPVTAETRRAARRKIWTIILILVGGALAIGMLGCATEVSCTYEFNYLWALKGDPMAKLDLPGTELDRSSSKVGGTVMGKPVYTEITRVYRIDNQAKADGLLEQAAAYAESSGWKIELSSSQDAYRGTKGPETGRADIYIGLTRDDELIVIITDRHAK
jgi:hypothetical protein